MPNRPFLPLLAAVMLAVCPGGGVRAETLMPGDQLAVQITSLGEFSNSFQQVDGPQGVYTVARDGSVDLGFLGRYETTGKSSSALGNEISVALRDILIGMGQVHASVFVQARAPVVVGGLVQRQGAVPFSADMTVRHAVTLAGGLGTGAGSLSQVEFLSIQNEIRRLDQRRLDLQLRIAVIEAEQEGRSDLGTGLAPDAGITADRLAAENAALARRQTALARRVQMLDSRISLLAAEITALDQRRELIDAQQAGAEEQMAQVTQLIERGLAPSSRMVDSESRVAALESQRLDVGTAILRARQALGVAEIEKLQLTDARLSELHETRRRLVVEQEDIETQLAYQRSLLALRVAADPLQHDADSSDVAITILRAGNGTPEAATFDTALRPGDLIQIDLRDTEGAATDD